MLGTNPTTPVYDLMATVAAAAALGLVDTTGTVGPPTLPRPPALLEAGVGEEKLKEEEGEGVVVGKTKVSELPLAEPVPPEPTPPPEPDEEELEGEAPPLPPDPLSQPY
ncbi:MAG: hypothetical protein GOMPHAMPRED_002380 [Gomphillus americanus]|uniref:Uncharacterized protein n=1 Tax=Gomphillus americanus TaxID=1940652 RepID=A0A8H3IQ07_9LECA|nr:MAG: hypothetical protein GOMPHAMPRED_002380 [Gomphillus americanus]